MSYKEVLVAAFLFCFVSKGAFASVSSSFTPAQVAEAEAKSKQIYKALAPILKLPSGPIQVLCEEMTDAETNAIVLECVTTDSSARMGWTEGVIVTWAIGKTWHHGVQRSHLWMVSAHRTVH